MQLRDRLYRFLRQGDEHLRPPEDFGLKMDLGHREHKYLADEIARWLNDNFEVKERDT